MATLARPPIADRPGLLGCTPREIEAISQIVEVFGHGSQTHLVLAALVRYLLEAGDIAGVTDPQAAPPYAGRTVFTTGARFRSTRKGWLRSTRRRSRKVMMAR